MNPDHADESDQRENLRAQLASMAEALTNANMSIERIATERDRLREALTGISYDPWDAADIWRHLRGKKGKP